MNDKPILTVACVYKEEPNSPYTPEYVEKLMTGVSRHLSIPHERICITDNLNQPHVSPPNSFKYVPMKRTLKSWWSKLNLFELPGPVLYFDLDTVIVGDLDPLARAVMANDGLTVLRGFYRPFGVNSGVMGWGADSPHAKVLADVVGTDVPDSPIYSRTTKQPRMTTRSGRFKGDQDWLDAVIRTNNLVFRFAQKIAPGSICSYKVDVRDRQLDSPPNDVSVVCFHGQPRPHKVANLPWMQRHWRA